MSHMDSVLARATPRTVDFSALHTVKSNGASSAPQRSQTQTQQPSFNSLTPQDIESVLLIYESIKSLKRGRSAGGKNDKQLPNFHAYVESCIKQLDSRIGDAQDGVTRTVEVLQCKRQLYASCSTELFGYMHALNPDLALIAQGLHEATQHLINSYANTLTAVHTRLKTVESETRDILLAAELIEKEKAALANKCKLLQSQLDAYVGEERKLRAEINAMELQDNTSVKSYITTPPRTTSTTSSELDKTEKQPHSTSRSKNRMPTSLQTVSRSPSPSPSPIPPLPISVITQERQPGPSSFSQRTLTLRQLQEIINDVYNSKLKADAKALETHQPRETMEQHLYTFLNQKYGLKSLILDWVHAIVATISRYSNEDNDVAVFGKILQSDIDEGFRFVQQQIKETVEELLRVYLRSKYPTKAETVISQMLAKRMNSHISEEEWTEIIKYMYNEEDSQCLISIVLQQAGPKKAQRTTEDFVDNRIFYTEFIKILLDFQLQGHERFLMKFKSLFVMFDKDRDGIINTDQFRELVHMLVPDKSERELNLLVNTIDPFNVGRLTFSECVTALSQELMRLLTETRDKGL